MKTLAVTFIALILASSLPAFSYAKGAGKTDDQIAQILIRQSINAYSGSCPCPYNTTRAGHKCGRRSAYSKPGGASPLCYRGDVTPRMIQAYRDS